MTSSTTEQGNLTLEDTNTESIISHHGFLSLTLFFLLATLFFLTLCFFNLILFYIGIIVDLQCCVHFKCAAKWFSYTYTVFIFGRDFRSKPHVSLARVVWESHIERHSERLYRGHIGGQFYMGVSHLVSRRNDFPCLELSSQGICIANSLGRLIIFL